jgi:hypothetical protein
VRSGPGAARTILLFHIISARPSKQPRMVRTFLKVHTRHRLAYALRCRGYGIEVTEFFVCFLHFLRLRKFLCVFCIFCIHFLLAFFVFCKK